MKNTLLFICGTNILVRLLTVNMKNCNTPQKPENVRPHYSHSSRENATPSSGTSPLASCEGLVRKYPLPPPRGRQPAIPLTFPPWMAPPPNNFPRICKSELAGSTPAIRRSFFPFYLIAGKVACYPMYSDFELGRAGQKESTDLLNLLWEVSCNTRSSWCHFLLIVFR